MRHDLHALWCETVADPNVPAHNVIPAALKAVCNRAINIAKGERAERGMIAHERPLPENLAVAQALHNVIRALEAFRDSSYN